MADFNTGQEILEHVIRRAGEILPTETSTASADHLIDAKLYINEAYKDICALKPWRWARTSKQFNSVAQQEISVTSISTTTVNLSTSISDSMTGRRMFLNSDGIPHRILSHTAATSTLTLESAYTGESTADDGIIYQDTLDICTDFLAFPTVRQLDWGDELTLIQETELFRMYPRNIYGSFRARYGAFLFADETLRIRIAPWTTDAHLFEITYNYRPDSLTFNSDSTTDVPILPVDSRSAIAHRALVKIFADKRDQRVEIAQREFSEQIDKMSSVETSANKPRLVPGIRSSVGIWR